MKSILLFVLLAIPGAFVSSQKSGIADSLLQIASRKGDLKDEELALLSKYRGSLSAEAETGFDKIMGNYYFGTEVYDSSLFYFSRGLDLANLKGDRELKVYFLTWKGILLNLTSQNEEALEHLTNARSIITSSDSAGLRSLLLRNIGNAYWSLGLYEKALEYYFISLEFSEQQGFKKDKAAVLNNIGSVYDAIGEYEKAFDYYIKAREIASAEGYQWNEAVTTNNLGVLMVSQKKYKEALNYFSNALKLLEGLESLFQKGITLYNIADVYLKQDSVVLSRKYLIESLKLAKESGDKLGVANAYLMLGDTWLKDGQHKLCHSYIDSGYTLAREINSYTGMQYGLEILTRHFAETGDYKNAYNHMKLLSVVKDTLLAQNSGERIAKLENRIREEKREEELAKLNQEKKSNRMLLLIGVLSMSTILLIILLALRNARKKNLELSQQHQEIESQRSLLEEQFHLLRIQKEELDRINMGKDQFMKIISHDLKNPISAIRGFVELMYNQFDNLTDEKKRLFLKEIFDSVERTSLLLNNIMGWVNNQTEGLMKNNVKINLKKRIDDTLKIYSIICRNKGIACKNEIPGDLEIETDQNIFDTIFRNLISNALKFTGTKGSIIISSVVDDHHLRIKVSDTGTGIHKDILPDLFARKLGTSMPGTHHEQGTGLGLVLVKDFTNILGGDVVLEETSHTGTTFAVILPVSIISSK